VTIVNWQGSAIFGPGSEWFWSMAQFIVVVVTLFGIYRQLQAQGGANALARIEALHRRYFSREMLVAKVNVLIQLRFGPPMTEMNARMDLIANFFDTLHDLYEAGFMTIKEIDDRFGGGVQVWWRLLRPAIEGSRVVENEPGLLEGFQRLNLLCGERALKRGSPRTHFLEAPLPELLDEFIKRTTEGLQLQIDVESDSVPRPPVEPVPAVSQ
jgi:hypothetical protein